MKDRKLSGARSWTLIFVIRCQCTQSLEDWRACNRRSKVIQNETSLTSVLFNFFRIFSFFNCNVAFIKDFYFFFTGYSNWVRRLISNSSSWIRYRISLFVKLLLCFVEYFYAFKLNTSCKVIARLCHQLICLQIESLKCSSF